MDRRARDLGAILSEALPSEDKGISPVEPEFIGEALVLDIFTSLHSAEEQFNSILRCFSQNGEVVLANVVKIAQDYAPWVSTDPIAWLTSLIDYGEASNLRVVETLENLFPRDTLVLRELAFRVSKILLERSDQ